MSTHKLAILDLFANFTFRNTSNVVFMTKCHSRFCVYLSHFPPLDQTIYAHIALWSVALPRHIRILKLHTFIRIHILYWICPDAPLHTVQCSLFIQANNFVLIRPSHIRCLLVSNQSCQFHHRKNTFRSSTLHIIFRTSCTRLRLMFLSSH